MITLLLHLLRLLPFLFGGRRQLALENLALRRQLAVYKRTAPLCRSETSWAYREMPGTWREHPKPPARAVEC
jgi:hypothetical protein